MSGINLKMTWDLTKLRALLPDIVKGAQRRLGPPTLEAVKKELSIGKSPVEGEGRFVAYSPSYDLAIRSGFGKGYGKRVRPVNLYLSGKMVGTGYSQPVTGGVRVGFRDKKAEYHNDLGAGKSNTLRRMLPTKHGEVFSRTIMSKVMKFLQMEVISKAVSTANGK